MVKIGSKVSKKKEEEVKSVEPQVVGHVDSEYYNNDSGTANKNYLDFTLDLVASNFNLGDEYTVTKFDNKPQSCGITLSSVDFEVTVKVKDKFRQGYPFNDEVNNE